MQFPVEHPVYIYIVYLYVHIVVGSSRNSTGNDSRGAEIAAATREHSRSDGGHGV